MEAGSACNAWITSYLDALLSAGLSTEFAVQAVAEKESSPEDADSSIVASYYVHRLLALEEEAIQQAWLKVAHKSNVLAGERDARLQYLSWRVWGMKRKQAVIADLRAAEAAEHSEERSDDGDDELPSSSEPSSAPLEALLTPSPALPRLAVRPAATAGSEDSDEREREDQLAVTPDSPDSPVGAAEDIDTSLLSLTAERSPKLYCVLISMHGLVRGTAMELGKDPDTGGQVKYVVELAKALSRHPAVHRVDLLTRLVRDPKVASSYGLLEEPLDEPHGALGGAYIARIPCGPVDTYLRKEALWPYVREFADNALTHVCETMAKLAAAGEPCELYAIHGHYADAGEAAALMSYTLGVDMLLTGHSLGRNKLDHLLKSGTMSRGDIEASYAISRRIEAEERSLDAALLVFTSTAQEVRDQWGLYDGYNADLERVVRTRGRRGRHFPIMRVIPPGLDFSNLKISPPPDPLADSIALASGGSSTGGGQLRPAGGSGSGSLRNRRRSSTASSSWAYLPAAAAAAGASMGPPGDDLALLAEGVPAGGPTATATTASSFDVLRSGGSMPGLSVTTSTSVTALVVPSAAANASSPSPHVNSPKTPGTASTMPASATAVAAAAAAGGPFSRPPLPEDPPIWRSIFRFLRNPRKPVILAMSRPDAKKNITTLVKAYGSNKALREIANLVLIMGNREVIDGMAPGSAKVMEAVLKLIDAYDLYGSVAYPKRHSQDDISDIYLLPAATRGVFVNIALQEPFGLTLIEAAAHGVPIVATTNGGPVDIVHTLRNGILVQPTDAGAVADALLKLLTSNATWDEMAGNGVANINAYSWSSHCVNCLTAVEAEKLRIAQRAKHAQLVSNYSASLDDFAFITSSGSFSALRGALAGPADAAAAATAAKHPLLSPRACAAVVGQSLTTDDVPMPPAALDAPPPLSINNSGSFASASGGGVSTAGCSPHTPAAGGGGGSSSGLGLSSSPHATAPPECQPASARQTESSPSAAAAACPNGRSERGLASTSVPLVGAYGGAGGAEHTAAQPPPEAAFAIAPGQQQHPAAPQMGTVRDKYIVFVLDSPDTIARLSRLLARKAKALMGLAEAGQRVGLGVASAFSLADTAAALSPAGITLNDLDFAVTAAGTEVWYCGGGAGAGAGAAATAGAAASTLLQDANGTDSASSVSDAVLDEQYDAALDAKWDQMSVKRVLTQCLRERGCLAPSAGAAGGGTARPRPRVRLDASAGHRVTVVLTAGRAGAGGAAGGAAGTTPMLMSAHEQLALIARLKRRLRKSGLRSQITAQLDGDAIKLHVTPLRGSRALALRHLTYKHRVDMTSLVLVMCSRQLSTNADGTPSAARFACSDAEDLVGGTQGVLVVPPPAASEQQQCVASQDGFPCQLDLFTWDGRLQLLQLR